MTRKRNDSHSTEFGLWVRDQPELSSMIGYRAYNLDFVWWKKEGYNKYPSAWMLLEEKRFMSVCAPDQHLTYQWLHKKMVSLKDPTYKGIHLIQFENTNPEDGETWIDCKLVTKEELLAFLKMEL